jgi:hypothetical protein
VQADAGKTGGAIERLLIEHAQIEQNAGTLGKNGLAANRRDAENTEEDKKADPASRLRYAGQEAEKSQGSEVGKQKAEINRQDAEKGQERVGLPAFRDYLQ